MTWKELAIKSLGGDNQAMYDFILLLAIALDDAEIKIPEIE
ncbi:hypothetical protein LCGC14_1246830 [marine sediment metagenome]|uniref:Uncharacterized protein n=1 Tax=marine sediment metagenome TaxID=412755 RepID=A0A0F9P861_9ZZZZ